MPVLSSTCTKLHSCRCSSFCQMTPICLSLSLSLHVDSLTEILCDSTLSSGPVHSRPRGAAADERRGAPQRGWRVKGIGDHELFCLMTIITFIENVRAFIHICKWQSTYWYHARVHTVCLNLIWPLTTIKRVPINNLLYDCVYICTYVPVFIHACCLCNNMH